MNEILLMVNGISFIWQFVPQWCSLYADSSGLSGLFCCFVCKWAIMWRSRFHLNDSDRKQPNGESGKIFGTFSTRLFCSCWLIWFHMWKLTIFMVTHLPKARKRYSISGGKTSTVLIDRMHDIVAVVIWRAHF